MSLGCGYPVLLMRLHNCELLDLVPVAVAEVGAQFVRARHERDAGLERVDGLLVLGAHEAPHRRPAQLVGIMHLAHLLLLHAQLPRHSLRGAVGAHARDDLIVFEPGALAHRLLPQVRHVCVCVVRAAQEANRDDEIPLPFGCDKLDGQRLVLPLRGEGSAVVHGLRERVPLRDRVLLLHDHLQEQQEHVELRPHERHELLLRQDGRLLPVSNRLEHGLEPDRVELGLADAHRAVGVPLRLRRQGLVRLRQREAAQGVCAELLAPVRGRHAV
eukprot:1505341-Prymnesium_polylepis.1